MEYVKIKGQEYPATINGQTRDMKWDKRESKEITLEMTYEKALSTFVDDVPWSIIHQPESYIDPETNKIVTPDPIEYDNSEYCVAGSITDHRNGTVTVKMGKPLQTEIQQQQLAMASLEIATLQDQLTNAITEEELSAAYEEGVNSL